MTPRQIHINRSEIIAALMLVLILGCLIGLGGMFA